MSTLPAASPIKCFRLPIPNPITDPNPNINNKKTKRHRNGIEQSYI